MGQQHTQMVTHAEVLKEKAVKGRCCMVVVPCRLSLEASTSDGEMQRVGAPWFEEYGLGEYPFEVVERRSNKGLSGLSSTLPSFGGMAGVSWIESMSEFIM